MLKKSLLLALGALMAQGALADVLSPEEALQRASSQNSARRIISTASQPRLVYTARTSKDQPAVYVFNQGGNAMLVSASDKAIPVLGYLDSGEFDPNNVPPQLQYWMEEYANQIAYAEENTATPSKTDVTFNYPSDWTFISPLCQTKWNQEKPFNSLLANTSYATGCVATAMAQVMKYHNYPEIGRGSNSYRDDYGNSYSMNFGEQKFDWEDMINDYNGNYTEKQAYAVAYLMKACGYSSDMNYGRSSGTQLQFAGKALVTNFNYDNTLELLQRTRYTHSQWATILYDQIKNVGPVLYTGNSLGYAAHAFVADGYDGMGYFHINWGWGGLCDGYYSLDALIPSVQGAGGSNYGGYNFSQCMLTNVKPAQNGGSFSPEGQLTLLGNMTGANTTSILTLTMSEANPGNILNSSMVPVTPTIGIHIEGVDNNQSVYKEVSALFFAGDQMNLPKMTSGSFVDLQLSVRARFDTTLPDGKYKVQLVWMDKTANTPWQNFITANGCHDYVYVTKAGTSYTVESLPMEYFTIDKAEVITPLYMQNPCEIQFTVTNPYDVELSQSIIPVLFYGDERTLSFEGDSQLITIGPKETTTVTVTYTFLSVRNGVAPTTSEPREYTLGAYDYNKLAIRYYQSGDFRESYYGDFGTVTMKRPGSNSSIQMRKISIANAEEEGMVEGVGYLYGINQFSNINFEVTIVGKSGFVATPLSVVVYEYSPSTGNGAVVYEKNFENIIYVEEGNVSTENTILTLNDFDPSKIYNAQVYWVSQNSRKSLGGIKFSASSGIGEVSIDCALKVYYDGVNINAASQNGLSSVTVYDFGGKTVASSVYSGEQSASIDVSSLSKGIYLVNVTDKTGNNKVEKVIIK